MLGTITWAGNSGLKYTFELYPMGQNFNPVSGLYIFCAENTPGSWGALYVGETQSFKDRIDTGLDNHDGYKRALRHGATHVAVMCLKGTTERLRVETDLRHGLDPVCNKQPTNVRPTII